MIVSVCCQLFFPFLSPNKLIHVCKIWHCLVNVDLSKACLIVWAELSPFIFSP